MTRLAGLFSVLTILLFVNPVVASVPWTKSIKQKIKKKLKRSGISEKELGIWIGYDEMGSPKSLFQLNGEKLFIPASLTKMITAAAALEGMPLNYKFKTQLLKKAKVKNRVLKGDLVLKGLGNPTFVSESMWILVNKFSRTGIKVVEGDIKLDDTFFDSVRFDEDREASRVDRAYDAPVGALSFNWNSVNVYVRPGKKVGDPVNVFADPASAYIKVVNRGVTSRGSQKSSLRVSRVEDPSRVGDTIVVSGSLGIKADEVVKYKSITQPDYWTGYQLKEFLKQRGIEVKGKVVKGSADSSYVVVAEHKKEGLVKSVSSMMKYSNNYVAEMLAKHLAAYNKGTVGNMTEGLELIRKFLEKRVGLNSKHYNLINPSGLTRENRFRPVDFARLLTFVKNNFSIYPEFLTSLPIAGLDGTLKDRMNGTEAEAWVRAKTGMLQGVLGLSGYAGRSNGEVIMFAFIFNGKHSRIDKAALTFDRLAEVLVE